ncbi:MAG: DsbA family protein [Pseudolabrys sp.]
MIITRRRFCEGSATVALATALTAFAPLAGLIDPAAAQDASTEDLAVASPLGDIVLGDEKAPVTIYEYASMTCGHCAHFAITTFPELKKRYIDTGKVRFVFREFPLDPLAAAGFMLGRCAANGNSDKYIAMIDTLFHQQNTWVVRQPLEPLKAISKQAGLSEQDFEKCLANQSLLDGMEKARQHAVNKLKVASTPTFFINGKRHAGDISIDDMAKLIEPYLKAG